MVALWLCVSAQVGIHSGSSRTTMRQSNEEGSGADSEAAGILSISAAEDGSTAEGGGAGSVDSALYRDENRDNGMHDDFIYDNNGQ